MRHFRGMGVDVPRTRRGGRTRALLPLAHSAVVLALGMSATGPALAARPQTVAALHPFIGGSPPEVTGLEPAPARGPEAGGTTVTIKGNHLSSPVDVDFGAVAASHFEEKSATELVATSPPGYGAVDVTVTTAEGTSHTSFHDVYGYLPPGEIGGGLNVAGYCAGNGYEHDTELRGTFEGEDFAYENWACEKESHVTPIATAGPPLSMEDMCRSQHPGPPAYAYPDNPDANNTWNCYEEPTVTKLETVEGPAAGGTAVTITGTNFSRGSAVAFGGTSATHVTYNSETSLTATSPAGSGAVDVTVSAFGGRSAASPADRFTYEAPPPTSTTTISSTTTTTTTTGPSGPMLAKTGNVAPTAGTVLVKLPGTAAFVPLTSLREIPFGSEIDATKGTVSVTTAGPHGGTQTAQFRAGRFILTQERSGMVVATLSGGDFSVCPTARERSHIARLAAHSAAKHAPGKHVVRKLWANAHGKFSTKGNYAAGAVQGTEWLTEDRCDGTLIRVTRDKVRVTNLVTHRHRIVRVHHHYLAKAP